MINNIGNNYVLSKSDFDNRESNPNIQKIDKFISSIDIDSFIPRIFNISVYLSFVLFSGIGFIFLLKNVFGIDTSFINTELIYITLVVISASLIPVFLTKISSTRFVSEVNQGTFMLDYIRFFWEEAGQTCENRTHDLSILARSISLGKVIYPIEQVSRRDDNRKFTYPANYFDDNQ